MHGGQRKLSEEGLFVERMGILLLRYCDFGIEVPSQQLDIDVLEVLD